MYRVIFLGIQIIHCRELVQSVTACVGVCTLPMHLGLLLLAENEY